MDLSGLVTFATGWLLGVVTPLSVEYLKRQLFDRGNLRVQAGFVRLDIPGSTSFLSVTAVNTADVPIIVNGDMCSVAYGAQEIGTPSAEIDFPIRLTRNEDLQYELGAREVVAGFLAARRSLYEDESPVDYSKLRFQVSLIDSTGHLWNSKWVRLPEHDIDYFADHDPETSR
jgi:hypothetical protein